MVQFLKEVGMSIEVHRDHFEQDGDDHLWIPVCAQKEWIILSGDKGIEKVALNVQAVIESCAKIFLLTDSNMKGIEWGAAIIAARHRMQKMVDENDGPFFCNIGVCKDSHVGQIRFVGTGKPKEKPSVILESLPVPETNPNTTPAARVDDSSIEPKLF